MDKEVEQTPAGGIDLGGKLTQCVRRNCLLFGRDKERHGGSYSIAASQPTTELAQGCCLAIH